MKLFRLSFPVFLFFFSSLSFASIKVTFSQNPVLGLWEFVESMTGGANASPALKEMFHKELVANKKHEDALKEFVSIRETHLKSKKDWNPESVFLWAAAQSTGLEDFASRTRYFLPLPEHQKLIRLLKGLNAFYLKRVWNPAKEDLASYQRQLEKINAGVSQMDLMDKARVFYGSDYPKDLPFNMVLFPIPAAKGQSYATVVQNTGIIQGMLYEKDLVGRYGVVFHEACHSLWATQSESLKKMLEKWTRENKSPYAKKVFGAFNEALATAIGNGYVVEKAGGQLPESGWYNDAMIDRLSRAIYPIMKSYFEAGRTIDKAFVDSAIQSFEKEAPALVGDVTYHMDKVSILTDGKIKPRRVLDTLFQFFSVHGASFGSPIDHEESLKDLRKKSSEEALLLVVSKQGKSQLKAVFKERPELAILEKQLPPSGEWAAASLVQGDKGVFIIQAESEETLTRLIDKLRKLPSLDRKVQILR